MEPEPSGLQPKAQTEDMCSLFPEKPAKLPLVLENALLFGVLLQALLAAAEQS